MVDVSWTVQDEDRGKRLELNWRDRGRGVRPMTENGSGVGLSLIKGFAQSDLRGAFEHELGSEGFSCRLSALITAPSKDPSSNGQS
jgi:two-component sensor histidine kinase